MTVRLLPYGDRALLIEVPAAQVIALRDGLVSAGHRGLRSVVPGARTVLVEFDRALISGPELADLVQGCQRTPDGVGAPALEPLQIPVRYDGPDLDAVASQVGLPVQEVVAVHLDGDYTVQLCGFSPGFGYLTGLDPRLQVPRLASPRPVVEAGSVALAGEYTGIYPRRSPGGWRLIGHTEVQLFDLDRSPPALLRPGTRVRFVQQ